MWQFMKDTLLKDAAAMKAGKPISLAAKWMKSINTSSTESKRLARKFCTVAGISERTYRKTLSALRKYLNVVEVKMSSRQWDKIDFSTVPSKAMNMYTKAFNTHVPERVFEYFEKLKKGETKINASTLYPYEIIEKVFTKRSSDSVELGLLEEAWKALPNYFDQPHNIVCCADVSGSMYGRPMATSIGLSLYCAERNQGIYNGLYLTFTDIPRFFKLDEFASIESNIKKVMRNVGYNTEMDKMFEAIYEMAVRENDAPDALVIVSDMEIDRFMRTNACDDIITKWVNRFRNAGLECPKMILWNAESRYRGRQNTYLARSNNPYVAFVSGVSAGTFGNLTELISMSAYEAMVAILNQYEFI